MRYPVRNLDIDDESVLDDETATLIIIEALITDTFESVPLNDESKRDLIKTNVENWPNFIQFVEMINTQKQLLKQPLAPKVDSNLILSISEDSMAASNRISKLAMSSISKEKKAKLRTKILYRLSVASIICFLFIGVGALLANSADLSNSDVQIANTSENSFAPSIKSDTDSLKQNTADQESNVESGMSQDQDPNENDTTYETADSESPSIKFYVLVISSTAVFAVLTFWILTTFVRSTKKRQNR